MNWSCQNNTIGENESKKWLTLTANSKHQKNKKIILVSGDEEYRSEEALPMLAKILSERHGFDCTVLFAQHPDTLGVVNPNYVGNIEVTILFGFYLKY